MGTLPPGLAKYMAAKKANPSAAKPKKSGLTAAARKQIPKAKFGVPSKAPASGSYPMPDKSHAANAKARAQQQMKTGNLTPAKAAKIVTKANKLLGK